MKIYDNYKLYGVENYYKNFAKEYYNPHSNKIKQLFNKYIVQFIENDSKILDLASGNGLIKLLVNNAKTCDPFFNADYSFSFEDITKGFFTDFFDIIICCYAYHLLDEKWRYDFLTQLSLISNKFIIISPSKQIKIKHPLWKIIFYNISK